MSASVPALDQAHTRIRAAIIRRRPIAALYRGRKRLLRPHLLGWNRHQRLQVLCYHYGSDSESGLKPAGASDNWRCLAVENLSQVQLLDGPWQTAENHSRPQTCIEEVELDVENYPAPAPPPTHLLKKCKTLRLAPAAVVGIISLASVAAFGEDPVAALSRRIEAGTARLPFGGPYGYLPALLDALHVPVESQMAVFSKTSIQSLRIEPANPRVLYFNDAVAVGWVRGGFIELAAQDPGHGINYYILQQRPDESLTRREDCLRCHNSGTIRLRSVTASPDGVPSGGETDVDSRTPFTGLWGGWFVTGAAVPPGHQGNTVFANGERRALAPVLDPKFSLTPSSDVVALMVFAHQSRMINLLAHPDNIGELVDGLLFADEAPLPGPIEGDSAFAEKFAAQGPHDHLGRGLRQFDLQHRLMRYPCSYMIYSDAFDALPPGTKGAIYRRMWTILSDRTRDGRLSGTDGKAIVEILRETKPDLPAWFGASPVK